MPWSSDGHVSVKHPREPWDASCHSVIVHSRWDQLKGTAQEYAGQTETYQQAYRSAKRDFNLDVAFEIVERCLSERAMDQLADAVYYGKRAPIVVFPHLPFDDEDGSDQDPVRDMASNALPFAFAAALSEKLGAPVNETIFQSARIGRTKLTNWERFLYQPSFEGKVEAGRPYILLDDVITTGGTFAALRSYIIRAGGSVVAATALAHKTGVNQIFSIADQTLNVLRSKYGPGFDPYWRETFGHEPSALTEAEAEFLAVHANGRPDEALQRLRETFDQTAATGRQRGGEESRI